MPKAGRRRKKTRTHVSNEQQQLAVAHQALQSSEKIPKSLIIRRGKVEQEVVSLVEDLRQLMLPYTASNFREDAKNTKMTLQHYSKDLALPMGVSHIMIFSQNQERLNMRLARVPEGPTLSFRVQQFSLMRHVKSIQRRPYNMNTGGVLDHSPVVVCNNFGDNTAAPHVKLLRITFQNMFPAINVATVKLSDCRRVVLFQKMDRREVDGTITELVEMRHYAIKATPVGVDKKVRRLIQTKVPNLNRLDDIADYITGSTASGEAAPSASTAAGNASDSEPEDETSHVVLSSNYSGRGNKKNTKSALKLVELGPRLCLQLLKVERGLGGGDVMYHAHVTKTPEEIKELKAKKQQEAALKQQRRDEQERNVERKRKEREEKQETKRRRKEERDTAAMEELRANDRVAGLGSDASADEASDASSGSDQE